MLGVEGKVFWVLKAITVVVVDSQNATFKYIFDFFVAHKLVAFNDSIIVCVNMIFMALVISALISHQNNHA